MDRDAGSSSRATFVAGVALGALAGALIGRLVAPKPGRELRKDVVERAGGLPRRMSDKMPGIGKPDRANPEDSPLGAIAGSDAASLGLTPTEGLEPTSAQVDATDNPSPAAFEETALRDRSQEKPWGTSLAYQSGQVGVDADVAGDEEGHVGRTQE